MNKDTLQSLLQRFFLKRLIQQRNVSGNTISSYRDSFRIYFEFLKSEYGIDPTSASMKHMGLVYTEHFCSYLSQTRGSCPSTVNNRMAALKSFLKFVTEQNPEFIDTVRGSLMIPLQKKEQTVMSFLTKEEFDAYVGKCDTRTPIGARDKLMLLLLYNTGVRVSELLSIKYSDINGLENPGTASVKIIGKGRKERTVPLWKNTAKYIQKYTKSFDISGNDKLFKNKNDEDLTRSGVMSRIKKLTKLASETAPSLKEKNITPHSFRHSVAMNLLHSGVDISTIAIWLGYSGIETTHKYMVADLELKRTAMEKAGSAGNISYRYKPSKDILAFLNSL